MKQTLEVLISIEIIGFFFELRRVNANLVGWFHWTSIWSLGLVNQRAGISRVYSIFKLESPKCQCFWRHVVLKRCFSHLEAWESPHVGVCIFNILLFHYRVPKEHTYTTGECPDFRNPYLIPNACTYTKTLLNLQWCLASISAVIDKYPHGLVEISLSRNLDCTTFQYSLTLYFVHVVPWFNNPLHLWWDYVGPEW